MGKRKKKEERKTKRLHLLNKIKKLEKRIMNLKSDSSEEGKELRCFMLRYLGVALFFGTQLCKLQFASGPKQ